MKNLMISFQSFGVVLLGIFATSPSACRWSSLDPATPNLLLSSDKPISIQITLDPGWKINDEAPSKAKLEIREKKNWLPFLEFDRRQILKNQISLPTLEKERHYRLTGEFYFCREKNAQLCIRKKVVQEFRISEKANESNIFVHLKKET